jgi:hypothetical protein
LHAEADDEEALPSPPKAMPPEGAGKGGKKAQAAASLFAALEAEDGADKGGGEGEGDGSVPIDRGNGTNEAGDPAREGVRSSLMSDWCRSSHCKDLTGCHNPRSVPLLPKRRIKAPFASL